MSENNYKGHKSYGTIITLCTPTHQDQEGCNKVDDEQFLSDGRAVRIESEILINDNDVKKLENLSMAFLHEFELKEVA